MDADGMEIISFRKWWRFPKCWSLLVRTKSMVIWGLSISLLHLLPGSLSGKRLNSFSKSWPLAGLVGDPDLCCLTLQQDPPQPDLSRGFFINCRHYKLLCSLALQTYPYYGSSTDPRLIEGATILWKLQSTVIRVIIPPEAAENRLHPLALLVS